MLFAGCFSNITTARTVKYPGQLWQPFSRAISSKHVLIMHGCDSRSAAAAAGAAHIYCGGGGATGAAAAASNQLLLLLLLFDHLLCQSDYNLAQLELPYGFVAESPPAGREALAGLSNLQLLDVNISSLVRHAAYSSLTSFVGLRELRVEMVGSLTRTHLDDRGLPLLPQLTRLVMSLSGVVS
jgi:hypothetical protein